MRKNLLYLWKGFLFACMCTVSLGMFAQNITVKGTVIDANKEPIIGATVLLQGNASHGTVTDIDGKFTLGNVPRNGSLNFSYVGMKPQTVAVNGRITIDVVMQIDAELLDEVVVVGYGTTTKRKTTSAVATVNAEALAAIPAQSISDGLQGRVNGVIMTASSGAPGSKSSISIRGGGDPLYIIDGVIRSKNDFENINPNDVADMTILKDAAATAVYGSTGGNGVVLIATKAGKSGAPQINYAFNQIYSSPTIMPKRVSSYEKFSAIDAVEKAEGKNGYAAEVLQKYKDQSDPYNYPNTNWQALMLKNSSPEQRHDLSMSGGTDLLKLYSSISYYDQGSILKTDNNYNKRLTYRLNAMSVFEKINLTMRAQLDGFTETNSVPNSSTASSYSQLFSHIQNKGSEQLAYNEFGLPYNGTTDNPAVELSSLSGYARSESHVTNSLLNLDYAAPFLKGLHVKFNLNYNYWSSRNKSWSQTAPSYALNSRTAIMGNPPSLNETRGAGSELNLQWFLTYNNTFGNHGIDFTAVYEQNQVKSNSLSGNRKNYQIIFDQFIAGPTENMEANGSEGERGRAGYVGKIGYNYLERYFIDFSGRYDGNDNYPPGHRWGFFPSVSASYILSDEPFMRPFNHVLNLLKLRGSYGTVGQINSDFTNFNYVPGYNINNNAWVINGVLVQGTSEPGTLVSTNFSWYSTKSRNFGLDFGVLNNRLNGSLDYFFMRTTGYTGADASRYTTTLGVNLPPINIAKKASRREGFEVLLRWQDKLVKDFNYKLTGTFSYFNTIWENANESEDALKNPYSRTSGRPDGTLQDGYTNLGFYQSNQELLNGPRRIASINTVGGDLKYLDANGDGKIDGSDFRRIGSSTFPRINYGFTIDLDYKGAYFTTTIAGSGSRDRYLGDVVQGSSKESNTKNILIYDFQMNYWRPDNTNAMFPRQVSDSGVNGNNNYTASDFWLLRSGYARVKYMQLGYDLKYSLLKNANFLRQCKVFISGTNLFTFAKSMNYFIDPESDSNNYGYPIQRTISFGLNIGF